MMTLVEMFLNWVAQRKEFYWDATKLNTNVSNTKPPTTIPSDILVANVITESLLKGVNS